MDPLTFAPARAVARAGVHAGGQALGGCPLFWSDLKQGGHFAADNEPLVNIVKSGDTQVMLIALDITVRGGDVSVVEVPIEPR